MHVWAEHKSDRNEATQELSQTSLSDMNIPENGENSHEKDHSDKLRDQSGKHCYTYYSEMSSYLYIIMRC